MYCICFVQGDEKKDEDVKPDDKKGNDQDGCRLLALLTGAQRPDMHCLQDKTKERETALEQACNCRLASDLAELGPPTQAQAARAAALPAQGPGQRGPSTSVDEGSAM